MIESFKITTNSRVYRMLKRRMDLLKCDICAPNKGCNSNWVKDNNWKKHRKTQWR